MQVRKFLKGYKEIDSRLSVNNSLICGWKETAMMFLGDSDQDKKNREICITEARKIKAESDQLMQDMEELTNAVKQLSPLQRKIFDLFYVQRLNAPACCDVLKYTRNQFFFRKEEMIQELERMLNEDETHSDL